MTSVANYRQQYFAAFRRAQRMYTLFPDHVLFEYRSGTSVVETRIALATLKVGPPDRQHGRNSRFASSIGNALVCVAIAIIAIIFQNYGQGESAVTVHGWVAQSYPLLVVFFFLLATIFAVVAVTGRKIAETVSFQNNVGQVLLSISDYGGSRADFEAFTQAVISQIQIANELPATAPNPTKGSI